MRSPWANPTDIYPWKDDPMDFEQTEQDFRDIERAHELPPDEPYPSGRAIVYGEAINYLKDAIGALEDDNDPEDAIRCAREAIARIHGTL